MRALPVGQSDMVSDAIAVIGMACRFPGARNVDEFWQNLLAGKESFSSFSEEELLAAGVPEKDLSNPNYVKVAPVIDEIDQLDAALFGISPRDAEILDPQHRILLETCHVAIQRAGYDGRADRLRIGVFAGSRNNEYAYNNLSTNPSVKRTVGEMALLISNQTDYLATGVAYRLNLNGPAVTSVTACSTSLVNIHLACRSLRGGECDVALAAGVEISVPMIRGYVYNEGGINSPDGRVRPFDANARGTVFGNGCGVVVLKRMNDALADRDTISAVILGTAVNNDGSGKSDFASPSRVAQMEVIQSALRDSGVDPDTIGFVEAHGTGTMVGDPIEVAALTDAYRAYTRRSGYCAIASVKANVGHLGAAAGVAGFIKAARCVRDGMLPASLNFEEPNPAIDFASSPFYVNATLGKWPDVQAPRRAGISAFGIGGTNAHVIIESPPAPASPSPSRRPYQLLTVSARTPAALEAGCAELGEHLADCPDDLADIGFTLSLGRSHHAARRFLVAVDRAEAASKLASNPAGPAVATLPAGAQRSVAFLFPGQGAQYPEMARGLYGGERTFATQIDKLASVLAESHQLDLLDLLFSDDAQAGDRLNQTAVTQPALFAVEYALARLLEEWGVTPAAMAGHSVGEFVAASLAGVIDPDDAVRLVADRGALMQAMPAGSMLAVMLPEELLLPMLPPEIDLAAVNGPGVCVISGQNRDIAEMRAVFASQGIGARPLRTSHAFHSQMMEPVLDDFRQRVAQVGLRPPEIPYVSNLTGTWIRDEQAVDPAYWASHLRCCVRFSDTLGLLIDSGRYVFAEVGPGQALTGLVAAHRRQVSPGRPAPAAVATLRKADEKRDDTQVALEALGRIWAAGGPVDWARFWSGEHRRRVPLPTYPYERRRYWIDRVVSDGFGSAGQEDDVGPFFVPTWRESPLTGRRAARPVTDTHWVVFALPGDLRIGGLVASLRAAGAQVTVAEPGDSRRVIASGHHVLRVSEPADYAELIAEIAARGVGHVQVVHAWTADEPARDRCEAERAERALDHGFFSVLTVMQAAARLLPAVPVEVCVVTSRMQDVAGTGEIEPARAAILGLVKVAAKEFDHITCRSVDIDGATRADVTSAQLLAELGRADAEQVAYRGRKRWTWSYAAVTAPGSSGRPAVLKDRGIYLITGGLGGLGLVLARQLAALVRARLVLVGRSGLPDRQSWMTLLATSAADDQVARTVRSVMDIEQAGGTVLALAGDVTDEQQMRAVEAQVNAAFGTVDGGTVDGVFHLAAVAGGGMLEARAPGAAAAVLGPKVTGTYVLEHVFHPALFVLYSSTAVIAGDFGLGDYAGANAVLDAFAHSRWTSGRHVVSINWPPWNEVGMASEIRGPSVLRDLELGVPFPVRHPMLCARRGQGGDVIAFDVELDPALWVFAEHKMDGTPAMPGTGVVELIRAAYQEVTGNTTADIRDLMFPNLLAAKPGVEARVELRRSADGGYAVSVTGGPPSRAAEQFARGRVYAVEEGPAPRHDLAAVRSGSWRDTTPEFSAKVGMMEFGDRWDAIRSRQTYGDMDFLDLSLPDRFHGDLDQFVVHPALLDVAGAMGMSRPGDGLYLPFGYDRIIVRDPIPALCHSLIRHLDDTRGELARLDLTIMSKDGTEVLAAEGYSLLRVSGNRTPDAVFRLAKAGRPAAAGRSPLTGSPVMALIRESNAESSVSSAEGSEALRIVLADSLGPQVILCPGGIAERVRRAGRITRSVLTERLASAAAGEGATRNITTPFVPPQTDAELTIAELWRDSIGVDQVGIDDDFLDLGGDSLLAVQLVGRIAQRFKTDMSVARLFDNRTVRALAASISQEQGQLR